MTELNIGDKAPFFEGLDENGNKISLNDFTGKKLILFFYPKDMTPGCTAEACNLRDNYSVLKEKGFELLGVSADSQDRHLRFISKNELPYHLIADIDKTVLNAYGVWGLKKMYGREYEGVFRTTFIIDEKGIIEKIFKKVKTKAHTEQILDSYK